MSKNISKPPLIAHIIHRLDIGGMENGMVNIINQIPNDRYRHVVICLTTYTDFKLRIKQPNVQLYALHKKEGKDLFVFVRLWLLLRKLKPDIVHTRNFATLECQFPAFLARVKGRIHGEHGWDVGDLDGSNRKLRIARRLLKVFVRNYIALSKDIENYLRCQIKIPQSKIYQIYNGVDTVLFHPGVEGKRNLPVEGFAPTGTLVIGTVGRMKEVKDQLTLARAFVRLLDIVPDARNYLRLVIIGDGPLHAKVAHLVKSDGAADLVWLPGSRDDIAEILQCLDVFVLPSIAEGISNTILEAMASGLPIVATKVGGNSELIVDGETGLLVPPSNPDAMAEALKTYVQNPEVLLQHGTAGRKRVEDKYSLVKMVDAYSSVYDEILDKNKLIISTAHQ